MYSLSSKMFAFGRWTIFFIIVIWIGLGMGCATTSLPKYQTSLIKEQSDKQPKPIWKYPASPIFEQIEPSASLSGAVKPKPLPNYIPNVEPPFVVHMNILSNGSLVCVSPLEFKYESKKFTIAKYSREVITRVKIIRFNKDTGTEKWSRVVSAEGVYDIKEINTTLLFNANKFDKDGEFVETKFVALNIDNGDVLWERRFTQPFRYFNLSIDHNLIVFSTKVDAVESTRKTVEAIDASTGKPRWSFHVKPSNEKNSDKNTWPIIYADKIVIFEQGVSFRNLRNGKVLWKRKDIDIKGSAQPVAFGKTIWFQSKDGVVALDVASGKTKWTCKEIKDDVIKLAFAGKHFYVAQSKKALFSKTHTLSMIDPVTGKVFWNYNTDPILGNIAEKENRVYFSTADRIVALNIKDGTEFFKSELPWEDEFSHHVISLRDNSLTLKNEWNVAMWGQKDGEMIYHHKFDPLCPIMTTQERMQELKKMGGQVSAMTTGSVSYTSFVNTAYFESQFNQAMNSYRSTGDSSYLSLAQAEYGYTRASIAQQRTMAGMQFGMQLSMATFQIGKTILNKKIQITHSMVYPQVDSVIKNLRTSDNGEYVVRIVGVQEGSQRFSAIEVIHEPTGKRKQILLSPSQMPADLKTIGSKPMTAHELNGYHSASMYLGHGYSTLVDIERKCIFHYGPGLNVDDYVNFDNTGFVRGRLWKFALELP